MNRDLKEVGEQVLRILRGRIVPQRGRPRRKDAAELEEQRRARSGWSQVSKEESGRRRDLSGDHGEWG